MPILESLLLAVIGAIAQAIAQDIVPAVIQQMQQPSTAQDGYVDTPLISRIDNAIVYPSGSD